MVNIPWDVYPRPQMKRNSYVNLNGIWAFSAEDYTGQITVPFCPESKLSGIGRHFSEGAPLVYRRKFSLPEGFNKGRVLLHIGAADQIAEIYVNQTSVGTHTGGYESMTFDITAALQAENELTIRVTDDLRRFQLPYGKQTQTPGGMWYTPVSGIWQTVWLESVPETYIEKLSAENRDYSVTISVTPALAGKVVVPELGEFPLENGKVTITPETPHVWSPEDPYLYDFSVVTDTDKVDSYFAIRSLEIGEADGVPRLLLNGKPYFFHGLLDQGYWPDGIFTPPTPADYKNDILAMKRLGFNTLRKHIKVETEEFYYQCDKLGMIVFQDMVNNGKYSFFRDTALPTFGMKLPQTSHKDPEQRANFLTGMLSTVNQLKSHPCICLWTIFNEGWGQFAGDDAYHLLKKADDTRFIDAASGWFRVEKTDVDSRHIYFDLWHKLKPGKKPLLLSEFGGFTHAVQGHLFDPNKSYGYGSCKTPEALQERFDKLYRDHVLPMIPKGLCGAVYTQISDVEQEINGLLTYDRAVCKMESEPMVRLAADLQKAICP
ncbi:MAG: glycoside hydrolase family 2 [Oscillospiraceae bacterium]|nr:glycoside hydrolase family 2 [Oscillospiraceae bacterium]